MSKVQRLLCAASLAALVAGVPLVTSAFGSSQGGPSSLDPIQSLAQAWGGALPGHVAALHNGVMVQVDDTPPFSPYRTLRVVDLDPSLIPANVLIDDLAPTRAVFDPGGADLEFDVVADPVDDHPWGQTVLLLRIDTLITGSSGRIQVFTGSAGDEALLSVQLQ